MARQNVTSWPSAPTGPAVRALIINAATHARIAIMSVLCLERLLGYGQHWRPMREGAGAIDPRYGRIAANP
jgi:hypothetical protein